MNRRAFGYHAKNELDGMRSFLKRLSRVLSLAERWLEARVGRAPAPALFERHIAFRFDTRGGYTRLIPIAEPQAVDLEDLLGVDRSVETLCRNTEQLVRGLPANHVLLYGERGTGKSSAVKGVLSRFAQAGLRLVEVSKSDLLHLPELFAMLRALPQPFLIFCDDLGFDDGEPGIRELKAALEGSIEATPANIRIVATSNRRHLVSQRRSDNLAGTLDADGELHVGEAIEDKLALADRFGLVLPFFSPNQTTYLEIVERYVRKAGLDLPSDEVNARALQFAMRRGSRSGRTARHFVDDLCGRVGLERSYGDPGEHR